MLNDTRQGMQVAYRNRQLIFTIGLDFFAVQLAPVRIVHAAARFQMRSRALRANIRRFRREAVL